MAKRPLVFLDCETDGLAPGRHAWEVALLRRESDGSERALEFFLPIDASHAEQGALDVGRYYQRHPHGIAVAGLAPLPADTAHPVPAPPNLHPAPVMALPKAARLLAQWTAGATLIAANPLFDVPIIERIVRSNGFQPRWHYRTRDVEAMVTGFTGDEDMGGLAACAAALDVTIDRAREHTAMGDVLTTMRVYDAIILAERVGAP